MNSLLKNNKSLKYDFAIKLLSIIALVCTALSCIPHFFHYVGHYDYLKWEGVYELTFIFPGFINLIPLLLSIAPFVLFIIYIFRYHNKLKATVLVPAIFGVLASESSFSNFFIGSYDLILPLLRLLLVLLAYIFYILALINALKGFNKNIYVIIAISVCLLFEALSFVDFISIMGTYIEDSMYLYIFTLPLSIIGDISFYVALLLFTIKNMIPAIISDSAKKKNAESMNPEQALKFLKDKLELGIITEEEYKIQRADIINKL